MTTTNHDRLEQDLESAFAVPVPELRFEAPMASTTGRSLGRGWKFGVAAAIAAAAALVAVLIVPWSGAGPQTANADELIALSLAASQAPASNPAAYHLVTIARTADSEVVTETWSGGENRYRTESRSTAGGSTLIEGSAVSGDDLWLYQGEEGALTVAHGPAFYDVRPGPPAISLDQLLAAWTATGCFDAEVVGRETIAGREAHVVTVTPAKECPTTRKPLKRATLWIDVENHFPLKSTYEGATTEETSSLEVAVFETFDSLPDSTFEYSPPADGTIIEVSTPAELKQALAGPIVVPRGSSVVLDSPAAVEVTPAR